MTHLGCDSYHTRYDAAAAAALCSYAYRGLQLLSPSFGLLLQQQRIHWVTSSVHVGRAFAPTSFAQRRLCSAASEHVRCALGFL